MGRSAAAPTQPAEQSLFLSFDELAERLLARLGTRRSAEDVLDCFLLAAGTSQILEDYLQRDVFALGKTARHLGPPAGALAAVANRSGFRGRAVVPSEKRLMRQSRHLAALVAGLATHVAAGDGASTFAAPSHQDAERALLPPERFPPKLRRTILRLPNCFRSFDQKPEDCRRLVERFSDRWPDRSRHLLVVGLRTSGSYLAPLVSSFLAAAGYRHVAETVTIRPSQLLDERSKQALAEVVAAGGLVLVVDDPPRTGSQVAQALDQLRDCGVPAESLVLLLGLFGTAASLPERLRSCPAVLLPWDEWAIHDRLTATALESALAELGDGQDLRIESVAVEPCARGHCRAVISARVPGSSGNTATEELCAEGVGLGFFGRHALAVGEALPDEVSHVYGLHGGLLLRAWLPEKRRVTPKRLSEDGDAIAEHIAAYVHQRNRALPLRDDLSLRLLGRDAAWELAAAMLADAFGRARQLVRPLTHAAARRLVRARQPSVIDGATAPWSWFEDSGGGSARLIKAQVDTRAFSNDGTPSCDPILDLAGAAAAAEAAGVADVEEQLRESYEALSGELISEERWLVYRLVRHLTEHRMLLRQLAAEPRQEHVETVLSLERTMASIYQRYVAGQYLSGLSPRPSGPFCAIDIDGVLESRWLAFPVLAPAGALALRALNRHGYRVLLVTGRSLPEVRERCETYGLAGGVAEYGAAVHDHLSGTDRMLVEPDEQAAQAELESTLRARPATYLDPAFRHSIRAQALDATGQRSALGSEVIEDALARPAVRGLVRVVQGDFQTDFVGSNVDKGRGVRALIRELGEDGDSDRPLALGVGDTVSDLPFLELAERAFAPGNAAPELRGKVRVLRRSYQSGLLDAVAKLLGHEPASCGICGPPAPTSSEARLFLTALAALDGGKAGKAAQALSLAALLVSV